jgi:hypothetical protein
MQYFNKAVLAARTNNANQISKVLLNSLVRKFNSYLSKGRLCADISQWNFVQIMYNTYNT